MELHGSFAFESTSDLNQTGGVIKLIGTLDNVGQTAVLDAELAGGRINGGTVSGPGGSPLLVTSVSSLDGVTLAGDMTVNSGQTLTIFNGLTLSGVTLTLNSVQPIQVLFSGTQMLNGTGQVVFGGSTPSGSIQQLTGTLTIGAGITIRGDQGGSLGFSSLGLINRGTIIADTPGQTLTVTGSSWINEGSLEAAGGTLRLEGTWSNAGTLSADVGGSVTITGDLNQAVVAVAEVSIGGLLATDFGRFQVAGTANLAGTFRISLVSGFSPFAGDVFEVMTFGSRTGDFDTTVGLDQGVTTLEIQFDADSLDLVAV